VDDLVGPLQQVIDLKVHLELPIVLVHVTDLALLVGGPDIFLEVMWI
jgi:hypothetical protein